MEELEKLFNTISTVLVAIYQKNPVLYCAGLTLLLLALIIFLPIVHREEKAKRERIKRMRDAFLKERTAAQQKHPIYAAGSDMDSLHHGTPFKLPSEIPWSAIGFFAMIIVVLGAMQSHHNARTRNVVKVTPQAPQRQETQDANGINNVRMSMSTTYSYDFKQVFVTTTYRNEGLTAAYGIQPVISLRNAEGETLQEQEEEVIATILPDQEIERTAVINITVDKSEIASVHQEIHYHKWS